MLRQDIPALEGPCVGLSHGLLGPIRPPQRLAPFSYALGAEVRHPETAIVPERSEGDAFGRLILLHDPEGAEAWDGTMRLVAYIQADLDSTEAVDPLLPEVAWSWLVEALESRAEHVTALGGRATPVAVSGQDDTAAMLASACREAGIAPVLIGDPARPTTTKVRIVTERNQQVARVDYEMDGEITGEGWFLLDRVLGWVRDAGLFAIVDVDACHQELAVLRTDCEMHVREPIARLPRAQQWIAALDFDNVRH